MWGEWKGEECKESTVRTDDLLLPMEEGRNGRTFWVGGGTGRPRRPIGEGLTVPNGTFPPILGLANGVGSLSSRVERRESVGDDEAGLGPTGDKLRRDREGDGDGLLLSCGERGGDTRPGARGEGDGEPRIVLPPNGLRAGPGDGGGLCLLMEARGDEGGERRLIDALGEDGGLRRIMEARGE